MAAVFTLTKVMKTELIGGYVEIYNFTSNGGTYTLGGIAPVGLESPRYFRMPSFMSIEANNGYLYHYDIDTGLITIRAQDNGPIDDTPLGELQDGVAVPAGARLGVKAICFWFNRFP